MDRRMVWHSMLLPPLKRQRSDPDVGGGSTAPASRRHLPTSCGALRQEERGIRLVQLLLDCASHTASSNVPRTDATLRLVCDLSSPYGDPMQRLAARVSASLAASILRRRWPGLLSFLHPNPGHPRLPDAHVAFARCLPYIPFSHAVASRALLRAVAQERVVHLVDLGATRASVSLWVPVLRTLSRVPRGLKLTCVSPDRGVLDSIGATLAKEAETLDVPFQFNAVNAPLRGLDLTAIRVRTGEAVAVASVLSLNELLAEVMPVGESDSSDAATGRRRRRSAEEVLHDLWSLSPKAVVVVQQELEHKSRQMVGRFAKVLQYYGALFDSVESAEGRGLMTPEERAGVEEMLGEEMDRAVAGGGEGEEKAEDRGGEAAEERWVARMGRAGFQQERAWDRILEKGRRVVESWPDEGRYAVGMYGGCPTICWKGRPLYSVSAWHC